MTLSRERLMAEASATGFRPDVLEQVLRLMGVLAALPGHPALAGRLALKGGTALNLFVFDVPRLSVDLDFNYVGSEARETMMTDRPRIEEAIQAVLKRDAFRVVRAPSEHAGGKWRFRCPGALEREVTLEVDLNFMLRVPLWPVVVRASRPVGSFRAEGVPVIDDHELAAGKLSALLSRRASRDLYDAHGLLIRGGLDPVRLRLAFAVYGAMNRRDWRTVSVDDVALDVQEMRQKLLPLLREPEVKGPFHLPWQIERSRSICH